LSPNLFPKRTALHRTGDPPPLKWSDSKYGFLPEEDCNAEEETQA
jgi:hypothetical protein